MAVLDDYQRAAARFADWTALADRIDTVFFHDHEPDPTRLAERLAPFDVICAMRERTVLDADLLARLPALKLVVTTGMRNAAIDVAAANARGIVVCGTGARPTGTPELTWALILALARGLPMESESVRTGGWQLGIGRDLHGATIGIVGLGRVGARVAAVARAFGMHGIAWSPNMTDARAAEHGFECVGRDALMSRSDFVVVCMQLGPSTRGLIGRRELALMKPTAFLVNTSRGPLVDEDALLEALAARRIAGAGLDVFAEEPLPASHPFRTMDNVIATPHVGYVTQAGYRLFYGETVEDVAAWLDGAPIRVISGQG
jgi:phosphoglycerate dehydrogenase-like enzyme